MTIATGYLLFWVYAASDGLTFGDVFLFPCDLLVVLVVLGIDYLVRGAAVIADKRRAGLDRRHPARQRWRWAEAPVCLAMTISIHALGNWPGQIRFRLSRGELEDRARRIADGTLANSGPQWVGLFHVENITQPQPGVVRFQLGTDWDDYGICCDPNAPSWRTRRLAPDWFFAVWEE